MAVLRIAIVEDCDADAERLREYLNRYAREHASEFSVARFADGMRFLDGYEPVYDIVMMDIEMPRMDGMATARRLRELDGSVCLIFVTNLSQYAIDGYEVDAIDFLLKPLQYFQFSQRLDKAVRVCELRRGRSIAVDTQEGKLRLRLNEIYYVESQKHYLIFHARGENFRSRGTIKELMKELPGEAFALCHASFLVNLEYVERIETQQVTVHGETLPVSRSCRQGLLDAFARYLGGRRGW